MTGRELFINAIRGGTVDRPPVWLMRQAGRYLPEYRDLRKQYSFMELAGDARLITQVSLQPWHRFAMDGVIVFSDILTPANAMGLKLDVVEGKGPVFDHYVRDESDIAALKTPHLDRDFGHTLEALGMLRGELGDEAAVIGFVGAPLTVARYMMNGHMRACTFALMRRLTDVLADYAGAQALAGADAVQIFDTWASLLSPDDYREQALPLLQRIVKAVHDAGGLATLFIKESRDYLAIMKESGADVISVGIDTPLASAFETIGDGAAVQGNLDPQVLLGAVDSVRRETRRMLDDVGDHHNYIANLGHGVLPKTPVENVEAFVDTIRAYRAV